MKSTVRLALSSLVLVAIAGCERGQGTAPETEVFSGILLTDANMNVIGGDATDFQPRPLVGPGNEPLNDALYPAFPNPSEDDRIILMYQLTQPDSVSIFLFAQPNSPPIDTLVNWFHRQKAVYAVIAEDSGLSGVLRVTMETGRGFRSFGDIQFKATEAVSK